MLAPVDEMEILLRLGGATLAGAVIGLNRELTNKPAGMRTHALVGLGSAIITLVSVLFIVRSGATDQGAVLRTIQGIVTGIGFVGGGVILRIPEKLAVHGLTTAASIWVVAALGVASGMGEWHVMLSASGLSLLVLIAGRPIERWLHRMRSSDPPSESDS
jgi:putative Mg2+ transporter-C (MgtC) family protein